MAFLNGCGIDIKTITELAAEGLSLNSMSKVTGFSNDAMYAWRVKRGLNEQKASMSMSSIKRLNVR